MKVCVSALLARFAALAGVLALLGLSPMAQSRAQAPASPTLAASPAEPAPPVSGNLFLRLETGKHTAPVRTVSMARNGLFATGSDDKTVRLWDAAHPSQSLRTIRMPMAPGNEGMVRAVALSPDGRYLLATGETGPTWNGPGKYSINLFDLETEGRDFKRLPNLPTYVNTLAFDAQGESFYAGFANGAGIGHWNRNGKFLGHDNKFKSHIFSIDVSVENRVAAVAADGTVRLYDGDLNTLRSVNMKARPTSIAFSPDGGLLAVGTENAGVYLLATEGLATLRQLKLPDGFKGDLAAVAWARMGQGVHLLATGTAGRSDQEVVALAWKDMGFGSSYSIPLSRDRIIALRGLPQGGAVFIGAAPVVGRLTDHGNIAFAHSGDQLDFRDVFDGRFSISGDGLTVEFGTVFGGQKPLRFSLASSGGTLEQAGSETTLTASRLFSPALTVKDWWNGSKPMLGKVALEIPDGERSRSLAILPDDSAVLLGTNNSLRLFSPKGKLIKAVHAASTVWGLMTAPQASLAVAALGDGTLRWYSLRPENLLEELAILFVHPDGRRWIAWTPEGVFAQSDYGGNDLVGYARVEGERQQPEWITFSQLFHAFHKPSLLHLNLTDRATALPQLTKIANSANPATLVPPQVSLLELCYAQPTEKPTRSVSRLPSILDDPAPAPESRANEPHCVSLQEARTRSVERLPAQGSAQQPSAAATGQIVLPPGVQSVSVRFQTEVAAGQHAGEIEVFVNDANVGLAATRSVRRLPPVVTEPVVSTDAAAAPNSTEPAVTTDSTTTDQSPMTYESSREIQLSSGDNRVEVRAYSSTNLYGQTNVSLFAPPIDTDESDKSDGPGKLFIITIGVNDYSGVGIRGLKLAVADAHAFGDEVYAGAVGLYEDVIVLELTDGDATSANIREAFDLIASVAREKDAVLIYVAGHGVNIQQAGRDAYAFLTYDTKLTFGPNDQSDAVEAVEAAITGDMLAKELMSGIRARKVLVLLDTCNAGAFDTAFDVAKTVGHDLGKARILVAGSTADQLALDSANGSRNGLFAFTALEGLAGKIRPDDDNLIDADMLIRHLKKYVPQYAKANNNHTQNVSVSYAADDIFNIVKANSASSSQ
jgi:WD40 repeat protein